MQKTALVVGATTLVGSQCLRLLLDDDRYGAVAVLVRGQLPRVHSKMQQHHVDFNHLLDYDKKIRAHDVFCCLGTTMKAAGSKEAFRKVDFTYPMEIATLAMRGGAEQFLLLSAQGASLESLFFYCPRQGGDRSGDFETAIQSGTYFSPFHGSGRSG